MNNNIRIRRLWFNVKLKWISYTKKKKIFIIIIMIIITLMFIGLGIGVTYYIVTKNKKQ